MIYLFLTIYSAIAVNGQFFTLSVTNETNCGYGTFNAVNATCDCNENYRTAPDQDMFSASYEWCNQSVFDSSYYGETDFTEDKLIVYQLWIAFLVIALGTTCIIQCGIRCLCKICPTRKIDIKQRKKKRKQKRKHRTPSKKKKKRKIVSQPSELSIDDHDSSSSASSSSCSSSNSDSFSSD